MAKSSGAWNDSGNYVPAKPKKSRQGRSQNTILSATSRNKAKKKYRGQG
tara:strand:+ start:83 stop:229 length:147 start_codon:yes stop_codon:yes gene_type:complete